MGRRHVSASLVRMFTHCGYCVDVRADVTGPESATKAIFVLYDIFGYSHPIIRGVDKLADAGFRVFMPDFFEGNPAPMSLMPLDGPPDEDAMDKFCAERGDTKKTMKRMSELLKHCEKLQPSIKTWGLLGYCWGGYVCQYAIGADTPFTACVECHPGFPEVEVAEAVTIPLMALCSKDEPEKDFAHFQPALKVPNYFEVFETMVHGWLSARAELDKDDVLTEFNRGYAMMADWFKKYL